MDLGSVLEWLAVRGAYDWGERGQIKKPLSLLSGLFSSGWNHTLLSPDFRRALVNGQRQMKDVVEDQSVGVVRKATPTHVVTLAAVLLSQLVMLELLPLLSL